MLAEKEVEEGGGLLNAKDALSGLRENILG